MRASDYLLLAFAFGLAGLFSLIFRLASVHEEPMWSILNAAFLWSEFLAAMLAVAGAFRKLAS